MAIILLLGSKGEAPTGLRAPTLHHPFPVLNQMSNIKPFSATVLSVTCNLMGSAAQIVAKVFAAFEREGGVNSLA